MTEPLFTSNIEEEQVKEETLEDALLKQRNTWTNNIKALNDKMVSLVKVDELLNEVYTQRQNAVDYFYSLNNVILKQTKRYKINFNNAFNNIKINGYNGLRFSSDQAISRQVETDLSADKETIDLLTNQNAFIKDTIATIDNIIYGINQKVKVQEMLNGMKF